MPSLLDFDDVVEQRQLVGRAQGVQRIARFEIKPRLLGVTDQESLALKAA